MKIGIDADGVLYDTETFQLKHAVKYFKKKYNMEVVNENGYGIKEIFNCKPELEKEFWTKHAVKYSLTFKPRTNFVEVIKKLKAEGHELHIITAKGRATEKGIGQVVRALFETGLKIDDIEVDQIHYCCNQNSEQEKVDICQQLKLDVMIEDKKSNVLAISQVTDVLCMNTRDNQMVAGANIKRVYNPDEVYVEIKKIEALKENKTACFSNFVQLSKAEKQQLSSSELLEYYKNLREYYLHLPFDNQVLNKKEKNFKTIAGPISKIFNAKYKPEVVNEDLIPAESGLIFTANHLCNKDIVLILSTLKDIPFHPLGKIELSEGFLGVLHDAVKTVYVDRGNEQSRKESLKEMAKLLLNNRNVLIFPEGTHNKTEANLKSFAGVSAVYLSQALDKYLVPIALTDDYKNGGRPVIRFAEPFKVKIEENLVEANERLWERMSSLVEKNKTLTKTK